MTLRTIQALLEAKNIGDHIKAQEPWRHHALVSTIQAALRPKRQQTLQDMGQRFVYPEFARVETQFRQELLSIFSDISQDQALTARRMKGVFRRFYTLAFQLGQKSMRGYTLSTTPVKLTEEDKRWLETFLRKEFDFWKKFMDAVRNGTTKMDPKRRVELYVQTLKSVYNTSRVLASAPTTLYYWETSPAEHCAHCLYLATKSPFIKANLPTVPASGDTQCKSNCRCHLRIAHTTAIGYMQVKKNAPTREELLRGMRALRS